MTETSIAHFHTSLYIPAIQSLAFHLPHVRILGTNNCGDKRREAFKRISAKQYAFYCRDYDERVVASFAHQIQYKYYGRNIAVSIEGISLEHFSAPIHTEKKEHHKYAHVILCFIHFCLMTANMILPQLMHTANTSLNC